MSKITPPRKSERETGEWRRKKRGVVPKRKR